MSQSKAYDTARREFYKLRQAEQIERRVAQEEARHVGAYFGKTRSEVGMLLEDHEFENWKVWAGKETEALKALQASDAGDDTLDADTPADDFAANLVAEEPAKE